MSWSRPAQRTQARSHEHERGGTRSHTGARLSGGVGPLAIFMNSVGTHLNLVFLRGWFSFAGLVVFQEGVVFWRVSGVYSQGERVVFHHRPGNYSGVFLQPRIYPRPG